MPLLAYCMTDPAFSMQSPVIGVSGAAVESLEAGGVLCFFSRMAGEKSTTRAQDAALAFHRVLQEIFARTAILPFRFPTVIENEPQLISHLRDHAGEYRNALDRLRDLVQMEIRIMTNTEDNDNKEKKKVSGAEYLRERLGQQRKLGAAAESMRNGIGSLVRGWRQRESREGLRCFMLLGRGDVSHLQAALSGVQISPDLVVRVSGPWPATEFVKED